MGLNVSQSAGAVKRAAEKTPFRVPCAQQPCFAVFPHSRRFNGVRALETAFRAASPRLKRGGGAPWEGRGRLRNGPLSRHCTAFLQQQHFVQRSPGGHGGVHVFVTLDDDVDDGRVRAGKRGAERGLKVFQLGDAVAFGSIGFGELHEIRLIRDVPGVEAASVEKILELADHALPRQPLFRSSTLTGSLLLTAVMSS